MVICTRESEQVEENNVQYENNRLDPSLFLWPNIDYSRISIPRPIEYIPDSFIPLISPARQQFIFKYGSQIPYIPLTIATTDKQLPPRPKYIIQKKQELRRGKHKRSHR